MRLEKKGQSVGKNGKKQREIERGKRVRERRRGMKGEGRTPLGALPL